MNVEMLLLLSIFIVLCCYVATDFYFQRIVIKMLEDRDECP